jgi:hypothetical protein
MTTQVLDTWNHLDDATALTKAIAEAIATAGDDNVAEGQERRIDGRELYCAPMHLDLLRERCTDGSYVYNLRLRLVVG